MTSYNSFLTNMEASSPMRKLPLRLAGGPPYNFPPYRRFLEASGGGGGLAPPSSISKFKNLFIFFQNMKIYEKWDLMVYCWGYKFLGGFFEYY